MRILLLTAILLSGAAAVAGAAVAGDTITHPTSGAKVVVRVTTGGGFVSPQTNLRLLPSFTL